MEMEYRGVGYDTKGNPSTYSDCKAHTRIMYQSEMGRSIPSTYSGVCMKYAVEVLGGMITLGGISFILWVMHIVLQH